MKSPIAPDSRHVGARIQIARLWVQRTPPDVAAELGVAASTYRGYESGRFLSEDVLAQIARALNVPVAFFEAGPTAVVPTGEMTFRKKVRLKSPSAMHIQGVSSFAPAIRREMSKLVNLPPVRVPSVRASGIEQVEAVVRRVRTDLRLIDAPLRSTLDFVESLGISVFWVTSSEDFDAVSFWIESTPYILINATHRDGYRVRFSVLHEAGHLILHKRGQAVDAYEDEGTLREADANMFASALLMPAGPFVNRFCPSWGLLDILEERSYWGASCAAIVRRAKDLKLISEDRYRQLYMGISANGWRKREPATPHQEESRVHRFFLDEAGEFGLTPSRIASEAGCPVSWIHETMPMSFGYSTDIYNFDALR
jgi:Zn-dependent peptidase ImmA (M78 family)/transcriptional regulator with XRE-family HTH domain